MLTNRILYLSIIIGYLIITNMSCWALGSYKYDIIAQTDDPLIHEEGALVAISPGPSINDSGNVAFSGTMRQENILKQGVFIGNGNELERRTRLINNIQYNSVSSVTSVDTAFSFGKYIQLNNQNQLVYQIESKDGLFAFILRLGVNVSDFTIIAKKKYIRIDNPALNAESPFTHLFPWATISNINNNQSRIIFSGILDSSGNTILSTPVNIEGGGHSYPADFHFSAPAPPGGDVSLFPMITDDIYTLIRGGGNNTNPLLLYNNERLLDAWYIAESPPFNAIGKMPGISDNGVFVSFMGDHTEQGVGIFGEVGSSPFKVAGLDNDGHLDPGELYIDTNLNNKFDPGESDKGFFSSFSINPRVGVNFSNEGSTEKYSVVYLATNNDSNNTLGIYSNTVNIKNKLEPIISKPYKVVEVGDAIHGVPGKISNLSIYDPINNKGQITFWIETEDDKQAIIRATPIGLYGLVIGVDDGDKLKGHLAARLVLNGLKVLPNWAGEDKGNPQSPILFPHYQSYDLKNMIRDTLSQMDIQSQDILVFYYAGHGGKGNIQNDEAIPDVEDEIFGPNSNNFITDDELTSIFANIPKFNDVRKIFILDTCYAGGFKGSSPTDEGDLGKLKNLAIFAAAKEDVKAVVFYEGLVDSSGKRGRGIGFFTETILPYINWTATIGDIQNNINKKMHDWLIDFEHSFFPLLELNHPGDIAKFQFSPDIFISEDFDETLPVFGHSYYSPVPGDVNGDGNVWLNDSILALQLITSINEATLTTEIYKESDVDSDNKIGLEDLIYILQKCSKLR